MRKLPLILITATLLAALGLGCGQGQAPAGTAAPAPQSQATTAPSAPAPTAASKPAATPAPTTAAAPSPTTQQAAQSIKDLFSKADWQADFSCDMVTTTPENETVTASLALKGNKMRVEMEAEGQKVVWIADSDKKTAVMYNPTEKAGMKFPIDQFENQTSQLQSPDDLVAKQPDGKIVGEETVDGKPCVVYEYKDADTTGKVWIWKDKGFPLKVEAKTKEGTSVVEYKNVKVGGIDDKLFEIPADIELIDLGNLPGMPTPGS